MKINNIFKRIFISLFVIIGFFISFYAWMGGFKTIEITESEEGSFYFVYQELPEHDYSGVQKITNELNAMLEKEKIERSPFDVFQPLGSNQPNEIGFVINEPLKEYMMNNRTKFKVIPRGIYMKTIFPFKNRFSYMTGYIKINPALKSYRLKYNYQDAPAITINRGDEIVYLQEIIK